MDLRMQISLPLYRENPAAIISFHLSSLPLTFICYYRAYDNEDTSIFPRIPFVGERA